MIAVVGAIALVTILAGARLAATNGDLNLTRRDLDTKRAYAAAQAGIADYSFHLNNDNGYWAKCTSVPAPTRSTRWAPRPSAASCRDRPTTSYAIELMPATGQSSCSTSNPVATMLEQSGPHDRLLPHPLHRVRRQRSEAARSSPPSSARASSTTSTSPSSRPRTRSPTGSKPLAALDRRLLAVQQVPAARAATPADPRSGRPVLRQDRLRQRRPHQRPAAHQRRADDLRHARPSGAPPPT